MVTVFAVVTRSQIGIRIRVSLWLRSCGSERQGREGDSSEGERGDVNEFGEGLV